MIDWDDLRYYLVAAQAGTVTAAADILKVSRTTVTRRVESLEQSLGLSLYERTLTGPGSTEAGRLVLQCARDIESRVDELASALSLHASQNSKIRISLPAEIDLDSIDLGANMCRQLPTLRLEFVRSVLPDVDVRERRSLIAICVSDELPVHLKGQKIATLTQQPHRSYHLEAPAAQGWRWVGWGRDLEHLPSARWMDQNVDEASVALRVNCAGDLREAIRLGMGIGYLWDASVNTPDLLPVEGAGPSFQSGLWICMHEDVPPSPLVRTLLQNMQAHFQVHAP